MKEIDFLPDWYRSGRQRQISYRAQYAVLGSILVVMAVWSSTATYLVSRTSSELATAKPEQQEAKLVSQEFDEIQKQIAELQEKADIMATIDSRINVANVLAELSFLIDEKVVLSKVEMVAERFAAAKDKKGRGSSSKSGGDEGVRFRVVINGMATDASCVAELIRKFEDSPYFCLVYPSFSKNARIKGQVRRPAAGRSDSENYEVSEFKISCYLANYQWQEEHLAERSQPDKGGV